MQKGSLVTADGHPLGEAARRLNVGSLFPAWYPIACPRAVGGACPVALGPRAHDQPQRPRNRRDVIRWPAYEASRSCALAGGRSALGCRASGKAGTGTPKP